MDNRENNLRRLSLRATMLLVLTMITGYVFGQSPLSVTSDMTISTNQTYSYITISNNATLWIDNGAVVTVNNYTTNPAGQWGVVVGDDGRLIVEDGAELASTHIEVCPTGELWVRGASTIRMATGAYIQLESDYLGSLHRRGGAMFVGEDSKITGLMWLGIGVSGGNGKSGPGSGGPTSHYFSAQDHETAKLMLADATIEGAATGIYNHNVYSAYPSADYSGHISGGGVIRAFRTVFHNNGRSLHFHDYQNKNHNGQFMLNGSYFVDCTFQADAVPPVVSVQYFADLQEVDGVVFRGCKFYDIAQTGSIRAGVSLRNAGAAIQTACPGGAQCRYGTIPSVFMNLERPIVVDNNGGSHPVDISNNYFGNVKKTAIELKGCLAPMVLSNEIHFPTTSTTPDKVGIILNGCTGYRLEENKIYSWDETETWGIVVNNSGPSLNEIYLNEMVPLDNVHKIEYAIQCNGNNFGPNTPLLGVRLFCNKLKENDYEGAWDITANSLTGVTINGIAGLQADPVNGENYGTRNTFALKNSGTENHLMNEAGLNSVHYYYKNVADEVPIFYTPQPDLYVYVAGHEKSCISRSLYNPGNMGQVSVPNYTSTLTSMGGAIANLAPGVPDDETGEYDWCEYDEVTTEYGRLVADMLHKYMYPEIAEFMLDSMGLDTVIIYHDTTVVHYDSVAMILQATGGHTYDYRLWLATIYAHNGEFTDANNELDYIINNFTLTTDEENQVEDIRAMFDIMEVLADPENDWENDITSTTKTWLEDLSTSGDGYMRYWSHYFLATYEGAEFDSEVVDLGDSKPGRPAGIAGQEYTGLKISPNPAGNTVYIYTPASAKGKEVAEITDMFGRKLLTAELQGGRNAIDIAHLPAGVYMVRVSSEGKVMGSGKLVKQ